MKGRVKHVTGNGSYSSEQHGLFYKFEVTIESEGTEYVGEYSSKKHQTIESEGFPFTIGEEVDFEYTPHQRWPKIKPLWVPDGGTSDSIQNHKPAPKDDATRRSIVLQCALKGALEFHGAEGYSRHDTPKREQIWDTALYFAEEILKAT